MIAEQLCPHCSIEEDGIPATEDARELQRNLENLAVTCKHLRDVANQHRFHSFVMPYDPSFSQRYIWRHDLDADIALARRFNNSALPELLDRIITDGTIGEQLKYLSIRDFTLQFKAGLTRRRLRLFMAASLSLGIPVPSFIPGLLLLPDQTGAGLSQVVGDAFWLDGQLWILSSPFSAPHCTDFDVWMVKLLLFGSTPRLEKLMMSPIIAQRVFFSQPPAVTTLPMVTTLGVAESNGDHRFAPRFTKVQMEVLLRSFPNLRAFQNDEDDLAWSPFVRNPANAPPFYPNLRRLVLAALQPGRLHHLTQVLHEFPHLEELYYHRRTTSSRGEDDPNFSNADLFNGVHHCLRRLTYSSALTLHDLDFNGEDYSVEIDCYEERRLSDVPRFSAFAILEDLTIDQGLLGRMSTTRDCIDSPTGPHYPDLDWKLPQSLRRLSVRFVYDWPQLASQLTSLAIAKQRGQFPLLSDIFVVIVRTCTVQYDGVWPPQIPLTPSADIIRDAGELMRAADIHLWTSTADIEPPPDWDRSEHYPHDVVPEGTLVAFNVRRRFFHDI